MPATNDYYLNQFQSLSFSLSDIFYKWYNFVGYLAIVFMNNKQELTKYLHLILKVGIGVLMSILLGFTIGLLIDRKFELNGIGIMVGLSLVLSLDLYGFTTR